MCVREVDCSKILADIGGVNKPGEAKKGVVRRAGWISRLVDVAQETLRV